MSLSSSLDVSYINFTLLFTGFIWVLVNFIRLFAPLIGEINNTWVQILKTQFDVWNAYCSTGKFILKLSFREYDSFLCLLQGISRGKYSGIWQALRLVYKEEGFASLW